MPVPPSARDHRHLDANVLLSALGVDGPDMRNAARPHVAGNPHGRKPIISTMAAGEVLIKLVDEVPDHTRAKAMFDELHRWITAGKLGVFRVSNLHVDMWKVVHELREIAPALTTADATILASCVLDDRACAILTADADVVGSAAVQEYMAKRKRPIESL